MASRSLAAFLLLGLAACAASEEMEVSEGMWGPKDLGQVDKALDHILKLHLAPETRKLAEKVSADVHKDIAAVAMGSNLTSEAKHAKVGEALNEMMALEKTLSQQFMPAKKANITSMEQRMKALQTELAEKKALLAKEEKEIKLYTLQKALAEKKLELQNLLEQKMKQKNGKMVDSQEAAELKAVVAKVTDLAKNLAVAKTAAKDGAVAELEKLSGQEKALIAKMDAADKKDQAELDTLAKSTSKSDHELKKSQGMLKMLRKKTHRKYLQVKAVKKAELAELEAAITEIKKGDAKGLQSTVQKMQAQLKEVATKPGGFLH
jgi:hypothetical protein